MNPHYAKHTSENSRGQRSIMVLDEDEKSRQILERSLAESGHRTESLPCLSDLQMPEFDLARFDLVICDLDNGLRVWKGLLDRIRAQRLDTQLVLTSQKAAEREGLEALPAGRL